MSVGLLLRKHYSNLLKYDCCINWYASIHWIHSTFTHGNKAVQHPFKMRSKKILEKQKKTVDSIDSSNQFEVLADMVTPYWKLPYDEELKIKQELCQSIVNDVIQNISKKNEQNKRFDVDNIVASPMRDAYRNKDEFSVWPGLDGNPKTVGFFVGSPAVGKVICVPATQLKCIRESHKEIAQLYQNYIRSSPLPVCYQIRNGGFWRNIVVRSNDAGQHLAIVITFPGVLSEEQLAEQERLLTVYFNEHAPGLSLFHQACPHVKCTTEQAPLKLLKGGAHLTDSFGGLQFQISPDSFFQLNKPAAELMFQQVLKMARLKPYSSLLDLYCGTGAISLLASKQVRGCIGVEEISSAVEDATHNANINNITNCKFVAGRVEEKLDRVLKKLNLSSDIVAVLNPGRGGAGEGVISLLRQNTHVRQVIYISCKPDNPLTMKNFRQLCERVAQDVKPFRLTQASPFDLFPYTTHCELVLNFTR